VTRADRNRSSGRLDQGSGTQQDQPKAQPKETFEYLYGQFSRRLKRIWPLGDLPREHAKDILAETWKRVWQALLRSNFVYRGDAPAWKWLTKILKYTIADYHGEGNSRPLIDTIPASTGTDLTDLRQRERVIELAGECLDSPDQIEHVRRLMRQEPLPEKWSDGSNHTRLSRIRQKLVPYARKHVSD
jgi:DNA-directed RNA polymerase specialized sigma24 family protein